MSNKLTIQHKRSSIAGNAPGAGTLAIGELAINFADKTLYSKDASGNVIIVARDVSKSSMAPSSPIEGDLWYDTGANLLKAFNGTSWDNVGAVVGNNKEIQFNDGGIVGSDPDLTFDKTTDTLSAKNINIPGTFTVFALNANGSIGTTGQILKSDGTKTYWANEAPFDANAVITFANTITFSNTVSVNALSANGSLGTAGQVLTSTGSDTYWVTPTNGTVTSIATGTGLSGGPITATGTISLADTAVTPASYGSANTATVFTVDQQGRLTNASGVAIAIDWTQVVSGKPTTLTGYGITDGVKSVNGVTPDAAGNVAVNVTNVTTGTLAALPAATPTNEGDVYVVSGDSASNNGKAYISNGTTWYEISGPDMASYDARYVNVSGDTMTGTLGLLGVSANGIIGTAGQVLTSDGTNTYWGSAAVKKVNGIAPDASGNVPVSLTSVSTGALGARPATANEGDVYVVSGDGTPSNDGKTFIYDTAIPGWVEVAPTDLASNDARYINASGDTMTGTLGVLGISANGSVGTAGQVLKSDGVNTYWDTAGGTGTVTSITAGSGLTGGTITTSNTIAVDVAAQFAWTNTHSFSNTVTLNAISANGTLGTAGQVLTSTGTDTYWSTINGFDANAQITFANTITFSNTATVGALSANGSVGTAGQVLFSDGTKSYWGAAGGTGTVTSITAGAGLTGGTITTSNTIAVDVAAQFAWTNTHSFSNTITLNAISANGSVGTAGQVLTSTGSDSYWFTPTYFDANGQITFANTITFSNTVSVNGLSANGSLGTAGQVLISTGADTYWGTDNVAVFEVIAGAGLSGGTITANGTLSVNTNHSFTWTNTHSFSNTITFGAISANGSVGTAGQVLFSDGTKSYWGAAGGTGTVTSVIAGAGLTGGTITTSNTIAVDVAAQFAWTNTHSFSNTITFGAISANGGIGTAGQVLTSDGTKSYWASAGGTGTVTSVTAGAGLTGGTITTSNTIAVDVAAQFAWTNTHSFSNTVSVNALSANGSLGTAGQVLTSTGTDSYWFTPTYFDANGQITFANTITFSNTVTVNALSANGSVGTAGQALFSDGTKTYWAAAGGSKWTDTGANIYRNSNVAIGSTTAPTTALFVTGDATVTANLVVDTSTLVVDATNNRTGFGVAAPAARVDVSGTSAHNVTVTTGAMDLGVSQMFTATASGAMNWSFSNVPASRGVTVVLHLTNGGAGTVTNNWGTIKWPSATAPTLTAAGTDVLVFVTHDGGTTWRGNIFGKDVR